MKALIFGKFSGMLLVAILLQVSPSEYIAFHLAYAIATSACVLLLNYYASHMPHS